MMASADGNSSSSSSCHRACIRFADSQHLALFGCGKLWFKRLYSARRTFLVFFISYIERYKMICLILCNIYSAMRCTKHVPRALSLWCIMRRQKRTNTNFPHPEIPSTHQSVAEEQIHSESEDFWRGIARDTLIARLQYVHATHSLLKIWFLVHSIV